MSHLANPYVPTDAESQRARLEKECARVDNAAPPAGFASPPSGPTWNPRGAKAEDTGELPLPWLTGRAE